MPIVGIRPVLRDSMIMCSAGDPTAAPNAAIESGDSLALLRTLERIERHLGRIADHFDPAPPDVVDSTYLARRLGCTTTWIAELARRGEIPASCIIPGTGNGKPWKFLRSRIEEWLVRR